MGVCVALDWDKARRLLCSKFSGRFRCEMVGMESNIVSYLPSLDVSADGFLQPESVCTPFATEPHTAILWPALATLSSRHAWFEVGCLSHECTLDLSREGSILVQFHPGR